MVILRAWAEAPPSPGAQGRPLARATTLKTKKPGPCHREQSRRGWLEPGQPAQHASLLRPRDPGRLLTPPLLGQPTPSLARQPGP